MGLQPSYSSDDNDAVLIEGADGFRYPLAAEWQSAARCGENYEYAGSNMIDDIAWYSANSDDQSHPVGLMQPNRCGLKDMSGNVWEWVADDQGSSGAVDRVIHGGGWGSDAGLCRISNQLRFSPVSRYNYLGLRLARALQ